MITSGYRRFYQIANFDQEFVDFRLVLDRQQTFSRNLSIFVQGASQQQQALPTSLGKDFQQLLELKTTGFDRFSYVPGCENIVPHSRVCELRWDVL